VYVVAACKFCRIKEIGNFQGYYEPEAKALKEGDFWNRVESRRLVKKSAKPLLFHCLARCLYPEPLALIPLPMGIRNNFPEDGHYGRWACGAGWVFTEVTPIPDKRESLSDGWVGNPKLRNH